jgi:hypothetical protein
MPFAASARQPTDTAPSLTCFWFWFAGILVRWCNDPPSDHRGRRRRVRHAGMTERAANSTPARALALVAAFEAAGKTVREVIVDGRTIRVVLSGASEPASEVEAWDAAFGVRR